MEERLDEGGWKDRELLLITFPGRLGGGGEVGVARGFLRGI